MQSRGLAAFAILVATWSTLTATAICAQTKAIYSNVAAGRALALQACTSCHVVAADQPYKPIYKGTPSPLDFKDIANKPNNNAARLRDYLASLPVIPKHSEMANPDLTDQEMRDVAAFIMTLRENSRSSSR